jgi:hypothetical protein
MPLVPEVTDFPVYDQGEYVCELQKVELGERQEFGSKDASQKVSAFKFTFCARDDKGKTLLVDAKEVRFFITTGIAYGGKRSTLTKTTNQMVGRPLDKDSEAPYFDYEKLVGHTFKLLVSKEPGDDGDMRNKITGITATPPVDVASCLLSP